MKTSTPYLRVDQCRRIVDTQEVQCECLDVLSLRVGTLFSSAQSHLESLSHQMKTYDEALGTKDDLELLYQTLKATIIDSELSRNKNRTSLLDAVPQHESLLKDSLHCSSQLEEAKTRLSTYSAELDELRNEPIMYKKVVPRLDIKDHLIDAMDKECRELLETFTSFENGSDEKELQTLLKEAARIESDLVLFHRASRDADESFQEQFQKALFGLAETCTKINQVSSSCSTQCLGMENIGTVSRRLSAAKRLPHAYKLSLQEIIRRKSYEQELLHYCDEFENRRQMEQASRDIYAAQLKSGHDGNIVRDMINAIIPELCDEAVVPSTRISRLENLPSINSDVIRDSEWMYMNKTQVSNCHDIDSDGEDLSESLSLSDADHDDVIEALIKSESKVKRLEQSIMSIKNSIDSENILQQMDDLRREMSDKNQQIEALNEEMYKLSEKAKRLEEDNFEEREKCETYKQELNHCKAEFDAKNGQLAHDSAARLSQVTNHIRQLTETLARIQEEHSIRQQDQESAARCIEDDHRRELKDRIDHCQEQHESTIRSMENDHRKELRSLADKHEAESQSIRYKHSQELQLLANKHEMQQLSMIDSHQQELRRQESDRDARIVDFESNVNQLQECNRFLNQQITNQSNLQQELTNAKSQIERLNQELTLKNEESNLHYEIQHLRDLTEMQQQQITEMTNRDVEYIQEIHKLRELLNKDELNQLRLQNESLNKIIVDREKNNKQFISTTVNLVKQKEESIQSLKRELQSKIPHVDVEFKFDRGANHWYGGCVLVLSGQSVESIREACGKDYHKASLVNAKILFLDDDLIADANNAYQLPVGVRYKIVELYPVENKDVKFV
ncbi:hypothetical protein AKO1_012645 [Acrasis kona]|uniref:Uncharacterized protein n=1 Tax=Acrasis kona TaxID=1008807 RepID=A0AAW2YVZ5_9EUKA